jgi:hypothetical protein
MKRILQSRAFLIVALITVGLVTVISVPWGSPRNVAATVTAVRSRFDPLFGRTVSIDVALDGGRRVVAKSSTGAVPEPGSIIVVRESAHLIGASRFTWDGKSVAAMTPKR